MPRVKNGQRAHSKHKEILHLTKGYRGSRNRLFKRANEAVVRAGEHAFAGRKQRRRDIRKLWITRLSGALSNLGINYSRFMNGLKKSNIDVNRKMLSEMAIADNNSFVKIVETAKKSLSK